MNEDETAIAWARARAAGALRLPTSEAAPKGMLRLVGSDPGIAWAVPAPPETAGPRVPTELGLHTAGFERPTESAQVLACAIRCCWPSPQDALWPGTAATAAQVTSVFAQINRGKHPDYLPRAVLPALRRLDWSGWLLYRSETGLVRLGPRVACWSDIDVNGLRDLWRMMPAPASGEAQQ